MNFPKFNSKMNFLLSALCGCMLIGCGGGGGAAGGSNSIGVSAVPASICASTIPTTSTSPSATGAVYNPASITAGTVITDFKIENTGSTAQTNVPFTFGQVFAKGDLLTSEKLAGKLANNSLIPLQLDIKATHGDGSVRHAIISGIAPSVPAGAAQTIRLVKATMSAPTGTAPTASDVVNAGVNAIVYITTPNCVTYTATLNSLVSTSTPMTWMSGPIANEWDYSGPLTTNAGSLLVPHPHLTAHIALRSYTGLNKARVDVDIENNWTFVPNAQNQTYTVQIAVGGQIVYSKSALTHYHHARWRKVFWSGSEPQINIQHNIPYLIATKAVPNYDQTIVISQSGLSTMYSNWQASNTEPMGATAGGPGIVRSDMHSAGGRPDIGILPQWAVMYLLSMDKRAKEVMLSVGDQAGSWPVHYRDENTGYPVRLDNPVNQNISVHPNAASLGPLPVPRCFSNDDQLNPQNSVCYTHGIQPDAAHEPSMAYIPYLVTGDYYYLEELQFWAAWNPLETGAGIRALDQGLTNWQQLRGQAWSLRTMGQVAYITPDTHYLKAYLTQQLNYSISFYDTTFVTGNPNPLGVIDGSGANSFPVGTAIQPWQDDFFTATLGHLNELGFTSVQNLLAWKSKFQIGRMDTANSGYCWIDATTQALIIRPVSPGITYNTLSQAYIATFSNTDASINAIRNSNDDVSIGVGIYAGTPYLNYACASQQQADWRGFSLNQMTGFANTPFGTPAILGAALAMLADSSLAYPNAQTAWNQYLARSLKPDFSSEPEWALVPR